jgi:queuine tRNA-ribosyltransferase
MTERNHFTCLHTDTQTAARRGILKTDHGDVQTPAFCPVGTAGSVKGMTPQDLETLETQMILANAYHLYLRPGHLFLKERGGLHPFMAWEKPILTDSGGYQLFSMKLLTKISDEGVTFKSHLDGARHFLTPETVIQIEEAIGADILMPLDECLPYPSDHETADRSLLRTLLWAKRSKQAHSRPDQHLYGIVQGGFYEDLRRRAVAGLLEVAFDGYAIGGLSVGEPQEEMLRVVEQTTAHLPQTAPRYLMGVGRPEDIVESVCRGIDLFDCVLPTRHARTGSLFTRTGEINIRNARYAGEDQPLDSSCGCYTCQHFSRAYLRHLFMAKELLALRLNTLHNLSYYLTLMKGIRQAIENDTLRSFRQTFYEARAAAG